MSWTADQEGGAREAVADAASTAREKAGEGAQQMAERGRGVVATQVDQRSTQAGEQLRSMTEAVRGSAARLREQDQHGPARAVEGAAERGDRLASYLSESDGEQLLADVEDFARRQPLVVAGAGLLVGLVAARALKASSSRRYESRTGVQRGYRAPYAASGYASGDPTLTGRPDYGHGSELAEPRPGPDTPTLGG